ncbi:MAG: hypothetical protein GY823_09290 [Flavobacteriaceae bacterium]|nr:hypothetical protein [Alteromonadales bacterium]MCP4484737.1 hypothetical protein [Flavobacteriaceae bacterium]
MTTTNEQLSNNAGILAQQIAEVTIQQMYDTIDHQLEYANIDLDGDEYYEMLELITNKTIKNIINTLNK